MAESIQQAIVREVSAWPGVTTGPHRFGGIEFRLGRRELGHLHGNRLADLPFPLISRADNRGQLGIERSRKVPSEGIGSLAGSWY